MDKCCSVCGSYNHKVSSHTEDVKNAPVNQKFGKTAQGSKPGHKPLTKYDHNQDADEASTGVGEPFQPGPRQPKLRRPNPKSGKFGD